MSHIDELVQKLCPDGVEYKPLGEVGTFIRGNGLPKADLEDSGFPAIHYGQIHTRYGVWTTESVSFTADEKAQKLRHANPGDLLIATTSEDDEAVAKATAWLGESDVAVGGDAYIFRHSHDPKYMAYFFQSTCFQGQKKRSISGTKVRRISDRGLSKILIPLPPLEVQREIVSILDRFTALEAELEAELEARKRQYDHYQARIFDELSNDGAELVRLRDLGVWYGGGTPSKSRPDFWTNGTIPWVSPKDMGRTSITDTEDYITEEAIAGSSTKLVPADSVALVVRSSILEHTLPIAHLPVPVTLNQDMKAVAPLEGISSRFIFHALRAARPEILRRVKRSGGSVASLDSKKLWMFEVPVPTIGKQEEIVAILDQFDSLTNDLAVGLPAELAARRKQYEHYRNRLLTFKESA